MKRHLIEKQENSRMKSLKRLTVASKDGLACLPTPALGYWEGATSSALCAVGDPAALLILPPIGWAETLPSECK